MPRPATLLKKRLWHMCFPMNFAKFLRTPFLTEHLWLLLLHFCSHEEKGTAFLPVTLDPSCTTGYRTTYSQPDLSSKLPIINQTSVKV